jgi:hypothetical protein
MKEYKVAALTLALGVLEGMCTLLRDLDIQGVLACEQTIGHQTGQALSVLRDVCEQINADSSLTQQIQNLEFCLRTDTADLRCGVLYASLRAILNGVEKNVEERRFLILSQDEAEYYANVNIFGESFNKVYPFGATRDAVEAGSCYAAGLYTACVFHCMRVAEYALRKLASNRMLRIKLTHKRKPCPIEYAQWQQVIDAIRSKITKIRSRPLGPQRERDLQFLSSAADQCDYMKEIWRNPISHTRQSYRKPEALSVMNRVKEFALLIGEHKGTLASDDSLALLVASAKQKLGGSNPPESV